MNNDVRLKLYISVVVFVLAILYIGPPIVENHQVTTQQTLYESCFKQFPNSGFAFCWDESERKSTLPFWMRLLPYIPAAILLWINWLIKPNLRLSDDSYPRKTVKTLLWIGLVGAAFNFGFSIYDVLSSESAKQVRALGDTFHRTLFFSAWLLAPLLFHHLVAPISLSKSVKRWKAAFLFELSTPLFMLAIILILGGIRAING